MIYLYHRVPENMEGNILMPLNKLKIKVQKAYMEQIKKYKGREILLKKKIIPLNCLWNDVLHLTAVNPKQLKKALVESGMPSKIKMKWFKISPKLLNKKNTIVWLYSVPEKGNIKERSCKKFNPNNLAKYSKITEKTKNYFKESYEKGKRPLMFHLTPHLLYKGNLKIKDLEVIDI